MSLVISDLSKSYKTSQGQIRAVDGISLRVECGELVVVHGPSGCGKSTLLMMAGALLEPDSGTVEVNDTNPFELSQEKRASFRAQNIGFVFQEFHLIPYLSVLENVLAPTLACKVADARKKAKELLDRLGLAARSAHVPAELSTGEKQRVALARALLPSPKLLLADEPTGNLDSENAGIVLGYLKDCAARGCAVLVVTHNREVVSCADHSIPMGESAVPSA